MYNTYEIKPKNNAKAAIKIVKGNITSPDDEALIQLTSGTAAVPNAWLMCHKGKWSRHVSKWAAINAFISRQWPDKCVLCGGKMGPLNTNCFDCGWIPQEG